MNLTPEQLAYLKDLESPKKRRKFMLDCLVENALGESVKSVKISDLPIKEIDEKTIVRLPTYQTSTAPRTFTPTGDIHKDSIGIGLNALELIGHSLKEAEKLKSNQSAKSNYSPEEIEIAKSLNSEREEIMYTELEMCIAFHRGRSIQPKLELTGADIQGKWTAYYLDKSFDEWINNFKNDKND
jgi:hypothetical protein